MKDGMKVKEVTALWGVTPRRVSEMCKQSKITNVRKEGKSWWIPANTSKPCDERIHSGIYVKTVRTRHLPLPIGISDYRLALTEYYYVDKTMFIKEFLDERPMFPLFTRPRRFGKTLTMDMLRTFFEKSNEDTSVYFRNKRIWACGQKYRDYQGKYPVIFVTFKDVKCESWQDTYENIYKLLQKEFERHIVLLESSALNEYDKQNLTDIILLSTAIGIQEAIYAGNSSALQRVLQKLLLESVSNFDTVHENFYHGLVLGLCVVMDNRYEITYNRESGIGRYDIALMPKNENLPGILIELKAAKEISPERFRQLAQDALDQIEEKQYDTTMKSRKISPVFKYGVAFSGKNVEITSKKEEI